MLRRGSAGNSGTPVVVTLPARTNSKSRVGSDGGWSVQAENGSYVCRHCHNFTQPLAPGEVAAFVVEVEV
jgi:hypothetical protein